jgi:hypothetical protein
MSIHQLSDKGPDGTSMGQAPDDKFSFYGAVPVAQPVVATGATTTQIIAALTQLGLFRNT